LNEQGRSEGICSDFSISDFFMFAFQLYVTSVPMFNAYGKLQTGLIRLDLESPLSDPNQKRNAGLLPPPKKTDPSEWKEEDPIWKASRMLDQLERFEEVKVDPTARVGTNKAFGEIQPVPWLDALAKECCHNTLNEAKEKAGVSPSLILFRGTAP
jgi:hypothetical protein